MKKLTLWFAMAVIMLCGAGITVKAAAQPASAVAIFVNYTGGGQLSEIVLCDAQADGDTYYVRQSGSWERVLVWETVESLRPCRKYLAVCDSDIFIGCGDIAKGTALKISVSSKESDIFGLTGEVCYPPEQLSLNSLKMTYFDMDYRVTDCVVGAAYGTKNASGGFSKKGYLAYEEAENGRVIFTSIRMGEPCTSAGGLFELSFDVGKDFNGEVRVKRLNPVHIDKGKAVGMELIDLTAEICVSED
ncbi:MAG: hypothetical protein ACI4DY_08975 [Monoglobaceae bacterium]